MLDLASGGSRDIDPKFRDLLPYVINTSQGILSRKGDFQTTPETLQALIDHHLTPAFDTSSGGPKCQHLLFYAHGGLNSEEGALENARAIAPWWRSHGVYPIFFVWESSLFQAIFQRPRELPRAAVARGDITDKVIEVTTQQAAREVWRRLKANCAAVLGPEGDRRHAGRSVPLLAEAEAMAAGATGERPAARPRSQHRADPALALPAAGARRRLRGPEPQLPRSRHPHRRLPDRRRAAAAPRSGSRHPAAAAVHDERRRRARRQRRPGL